jgi:hypothetical protein
VLAAYRRQIVHPRLHLVAVVLAVVCAAATVLHYQGVFPGNPFTWAGWLLAVAAYTGSQLKPGAISIPRTARSLRASELAIVLFVLPLYLVTHLWNAQDAPWNTNGLFDDAAWDIYFARDHAFSGPFQAAFFDEVGLISRETAFHYYIATFFKLFGYNLLVFNAALLILGFVTVLFTTLTVHRLFRTPTITVVAALVLNFLPLHYLQVWAGHRYAIAAPLMMVSLYLLYSGFLDRSSVRLSLSALFAALCLGSAIMGKQFILGLAAAGLVLLFVERKRLASAETRALVVTWLIAFVIAAIPLATYVAFNTDDYVRREQGFVSGFLSPFLTQGYAGIQPFVDQLGELFFDRDTYRRMWQHDYPLIPAAYWLLLVPGILIAVARRRVEIALLAIIPVVSALLSGAYDFRVLLAAPIWVIAMAYVLDAISVGRTEVDRPPRRRLAQLAAVVIVGAGLLPSIAYVWGVSRDPHAEYLLSHRDVAVSRLIQDVVAGSPQPTAEMKPDEFDRPVTEQALDFDDLACPTTAYAVAHLYLQPFDNRRILDFCDGGSQSLVGEDRLLAANVRAIAAYEPRGRGLKLIWEESPISEDVIDRFAQLETFGSTERLEGTVDGVPFSLYILSIPQENVARFRGAVAGLPEAQP